MSNDGDTLLLHEIFYNWVRSRALKMFKHFFTLNSSYITNHINYGPNFFTKNAVIYLPHFGHK